MKQFFLEVNIFLLLCALSVLPAKAHQDAEVVGNTIFYYNYVDGGVEITYNSNTFNNLYSVTIEIPAIRFQFMPLPRDLTIPMWLKHASSSCRIRRAMTSPPT